MDINTDTGLDTGMEIGIEMDIGIGIEMITPNHVAASLAARSDDALAPSLPFLLLVAV